MIKSPLLEVFKIEPRLKHPTIFEHFDALITGESFIIKNDHDPKPLYYQLLGERGNIFTWDYLESGPEYWQVRIGKPITSEEPETIGRVAAKDIRKAELLKQLGVDFFCGGKQSLKEAAESIDMSEAELRESLRKTEEIPAPIKQLDFENWDSDFLSDYIKNVHHKYIKFHGPIIQELATKVALIHSHEQPELSVLAKELDEFMEKAYQHLEKEEKQLFPVTKSLYELTYKQTEQLIDYLTLEHENAGADLRELRTITNNYTLPENACHSYISLFTQIKAFESDLLQHIHLENNILFPRIIQTYRTRFS
ncbi:DUF542 domain-containing protein [Pseudopedobacter sp.]|uniref:DUF542 domain-containing protein n=1 Tax=Pseudopedobacter sp. TaxID=1936787 RepID=UPI0033417494